jgi:hypothetical protein
MPASPTPTQVDPRGPRFGAAVTTVVLAAVLVLDRDGAVRRRIVGAPRRQDAVEALSGLTDVTTDTIDSSAA